MPNNNIGKTKILYGWLNRNEENEKKKNAKNPSKYAKRLEEPHQKLDKNMEKNKQSSRKHNKKKKLKVKVKICVTMFFGVHHNTQILTDGNGYPVSI